MVMLGWVLAAAMGGNKGKANEGACRAAMEAWVEQCVFADQLESPFYGDDALFRGSPAGSAAHHIKQTLGGRKRAFRPQRH